MYIRRAISMLAAAISVGVCVFITYISSDVEQETLLFNLAFLAVMLIMVAASCIVCLGRLIRDCSSLKIATQAIRDGQGEAFFNADEHSVLFENEFLDSCHQQYCRMIRSNPKTSCDIKGFLNEEVIENHAHRGLLEMIPDLLTSLGILGTFVGLVMGLREFDPSGYVQMAGSVTPLINGIKVAFITSIYGISLSLAFSFNLRSEFGYLSATVEEFLEAYYLYVRPPYEVDSLSKLLETQKSQEELQNEMNSLFVQQMVQSFEHVLTPAFNRMNDGLNQVVESFTENQQKAVSQICETIVGQMREEMNGEIEKISATVTELEHSHRSYAEFMDQSQRTYTEFMESSQHAYTKFMDQSMDRLQQSLVSMQESISQIGEHSDHSIEQLNTAHAEALRISQEQKATYQEYIRFMYQSIDKFSDVWEHNAQKMQDCSDEIARLGPVQFNRDLKEELQIISGRLQAIEKHQRVAMMSEDYTMEEDIADMLRNTLRKLDDLEDIVSTPSFFRSRRSKKNDK